MKHTIQNEAFELVQQAEQAQPGLKSPGISHPGISPGFAARSPRSNITNRER